LFVFLKGRWFDYLVTDSAEQLRLTVPLQQQAGGSENESLDKDSKDD